MRAWLPSARSRIDAALPVVNLPGAMSCLRLALLALVCAARVLAQATLTVENFNNPGATGAVILGTS